jgi:hypothetical protein
MSFYLPTRKDDVTIPAQPAKTYPSATKHGHNFTYPTLEIMVAFGTQKCHMNRCVSLRRENVQFATFSSSSRK